MTGRRVVDVQRILQLIHEADGCPDPHVQAATETAVSVVARNIRNRQAIISNDAAERIKTLERYVSDGVQYKTGA